MTNLVVKLKEKMTQEGLTAYSLERNAGLKPNAVHNIISGRSKNPSINVLQTIAQTLNCTVSDLIGEVNLGSHFNNAPSENPVTFCEILDNELYIKSLSYFAELLTKHKCWMAKEKILECVEEIYLYSYRKGLNKVDTHFAKWFFEKTRV